MKNKEEYFTVSQAGAMFEALRSDLRLIVEKIQFMDDRLERHEAHFDRIEEKLEETSMIAREALSVGREALAEAKGANTLARDTAKDVKVIRSHVTKQDRRILKIEKRAV